MELDAQRIAIAKACGTDRPYYMDGARYIDSPNYPTSLDAMHEAEMTLDDEQDLDYSEALARVVGASWNTTNACDMRRLRSATAKQRAEAFLITKGYP